MPFLGGREVPLLHNGGAFFFRFAIFHGNPAILIQVSEGKEKIGSPHPRLNGTLAPFVSKDSGLVVVQTGTVGYVHQTQICLCLGMALLRRLGQPFHGGIVVSKSI